MPPDGMFFQDNYWPWSGPSLARRIQELKGLYVCLHVNTGRAVLVEDGICQGIEGDVVVLLSQGQRSQIRLREVTAVNRLVPEN
jgi:hypothetical protein